MEDEGRQRKLEAGKEKFAAYLKKKNASGHLSEQKKKKKIENEAEDTSSVERELLPSLHENSERIKLDTSCKSNGTSIASDEGKLVSDDAPHERLHGRVRELEDILSGKEAALEAAYEELSALKKISSLDMSSGMFETDYKARLEEYHKRLQEFQEAVQDRERIIGQLSSSLKQAIETRDALQLQGDHLAQEVALLQRQLKATIESIQSHQWDTGIKPHDYLALQNQMLALEAAVGKNESIVEDLRNIITERDMMLLGKSDELEKKSQELSLQKTKSANEIQKLMREVEEQQQKCAMQTSNQNSLIVEHEGQMASLQSEMEENFGLQLVQIKEELRNQFNEERQKIEKEHAEEMASCQALVIKLTEMSSKSEVDLASIENEQLNLIQLQLQNTLEAKEQVEKEIALFRDTHQSQVSILQQNISKLQNELEEAEKMKQNFEQNMLEMRNYYEEEFSSYKKQVENLNFQLQEASKTEANLSSQVLKYETELSSCQQSHEMELSSLRQRVEALNLRLQEASEAEENFPKVLAAHKQSLESELTRYKEENGLLNTDVQSMKINLDTLQKENNELQKSHKIATLTYEQQSQNLRLSAEETTTTLRNEVISLKLQLEESNKTVEEYVKEMASYKERISVLNVQLEKVVNENKTLKEELICCKEAQKEEINLLKQKFDMELNERASNTKCQPHEEELASCKQQIDFLNARLQDANEAEKCHVYEINACQVQLREYKEQVKSLDRQFNDLISAQETYLKEVALKNQEIETLQECVKEASSMEEQYKSEKISFQSEIDNLNKQLNERMETEKQLSDEMASYQEQLTAYSVQVEALKKLANTQDELQAYKQQVETLKESLQCEVSRLSSIHGTEIKEKEEHHALEVASLNKQLEDVTSQLAEVCTMRESLESERNTNQEMHMSEIIVYKHQLEELNTQLQKYSTNEEKYIEDLTQYQTQLSSHKNIIETLYAKLEEETSQLKEVYLRELDEYKNKVLNLESDKTKLEASLSDALKQRDDATTLNRAQLEEITIQYLKLQTLLAARDEVEENLEKRMKDLQSELNSAKETITQMKQENDQLQEMTVQYLKLEGLLAGKDEMIKAMTDRNQQLEETLGNVTENLEESNRERTSVTQRVAKAKELLSRLKVEKDELAEKCKNLEKEKEKLLFILNEGQLKDVAAEITQVKTIALENNCDLPIENTCSSKVVAPLEATASITTNTSNEQTVIMIENNENVHNVNSTQVPESGPLKRRKRELIEVEEPVSPYLPQKWVDKLITLENEKIDLANQLELLESKLMEKEIQEVIYKKETNTINLQCKELEEKLLQLEKDKTQLGIVLQEKRNLELQITNLMCENTTFHNLQEALNNELAEERISREEKIHNDLKEKYAIIINEKNADSLGQLILDLGNKAKENIFFQEKMRIQEHTYQSLQKKVLQFEEYKDHDAKKLQMAKDELERVHNELEESWKLHQATKDELGNLKKEYAMLQLQKQQLESSRSRMLQMGHSQFDITPAYASSIHGVMEELASEVEALKSSLEFEQHRNEKLALELEVAQNNSTTDVNSNNNGTGMLELQHKLQLILKSNTELVAEKESLLDKLRNQQQFIGKLQQAGGYEQVENWMSNLDKQQTDLMAELRAYREQHTSLAELVGSTGVLQETLYRQKQELLHKFQEKSEIEKCLENERAELKTAQLKIQMMEHQLLEKDRISQELTRQKRLLEQDLHEIEDRLRDQEDKLESQKQALEAEVHARDLHIQHWQLELRRKQVEINTEQIMKTYNQKAKHCTNESENKNAEDEQRLELWHSQMDEIHQQAIARLRHHLGEQFSAKEAELKKNFSAEVATLEKQHKEQLLNLQHQLDDKVKEIKVLINKEMCHQLRIRQDLPTRITAEELANIKKKQETELEELKNTLDEQQKEIYSVMKEKFEKFAEEQIILAINVLQEEHNSIHQQEVSILVQKHTEELKVLESKLEKQRYEELMHLRQELSRKYKNELNEVTKGLKLEFSVLNHPFSKFKGVYFQHLKQDMLTEYTSSMKNYVHSWFVKCQEHFEIINKQIENIWHSSKNLETEKRKEISAPLPEIEKLLENKEQFLTQLEGLQEEIIKHHVEALQKLEAQFDIEHSKLKEGIENMNKTVQEGAAIASLQEQIAVLEEEKKDIENKHRLAVDLLSQEQQVANLRQELEAKHAKEMEELRRYFEQKCADVEKHYSEEVFSQHSRKMSGSSSGSEEMVSDMYYAGGDHGQRLTALTHICDSYTVEPSFKDLEEHYRSDFEKRIIEYRDQLDTVKQELEQKYQHEMELLREEYESKVQELVKDISNTHKAEIQNLESKHEKEIMNLKEKFQTESAAELSNIKLDCAGEVERVKKEIEEIHKQELGTLKDEYESKMRTQIENLTKQMKQEEVKHVEAVKSQLLNKHVKDIQELEESFADHVVDEMGKTSSNSVLQKVDMEHKIQMDLKQHFEEEHKKKMEEVIIEIQNKHAKELETERKILTEQFDEVTSMLKKSAEEEQENFLLNQKEMVSNLMKQHQKDLQTLKIQLEEESKRLGREKVHQVKEKYEKENRFLKEELSKLTQNRDTCKIQMQTMSTKSVESTVGDNRTTQQTVEQLQHEIKEQDAKLAEMKALHEIELEQVRALCEGRLHDEVEQAKHDIVRALEEQIQALLANDSEDTPWPQELVELQEKLSARYKRELDELKKEHAKKVTQLKEQSESELQSLSEKYNHLERQHQEYVEQEMALLTQKVDLNVTNTGTFVHYSTLKELQSLKRQIIKLEKTKHAIQMKLGEMKDDGEDAISILHADLEHLIKERDGLRKMSSTLRYLLGELVAYFTVCEDELNNTLIGELLKIESDNSPSGAETSKMNSTLADQGSIADDTNAKSNDSSGRRSDSSIKTGDTFSIESPVTSLNDADATMAPEQACEDISMVSQNMEKSLVPATPRSVSRRVHFAPDTSGIISLIEEDKMLDYFEKNKDLSTDFRSELEHCLERLKEEASALLGLSDALPRTVQITREAVSALEEKVNILTSRLETEVKSKDELLLELQKLQETEKESTQLQEQFDGLEMDLRLARARVVELERELGKREDISEGFGESIQPGLVRRLQNMAQLQDKARSVLNERSEDNQKSPHLQLIEELCHEGDRLSEEARKEREDLQQQVDAADKQLRATRQFLEDQAAEREQERDDFLREIAKLQEQLRERDRDRSEHQQLTKEVEALELQVKEAAALQKESDLKKEELETELKAAVDKIWVLRDIICELESQVETKAQHETSLEQQLRELHAILEQQSQNHQELAEELDSLRVDSGKSELTEHINHLEEQLRKHRLHVEQFQSNSTAVKQMKAQLRDLEAAVDKKTKDLEAFHANVSSGSCSSPSEDVSVREHLDSFRCDTPESQSQSPVCLPLDELHRLQDKLQRHSRAEEVALKRIRDLEMQLKSVKRNEEEVTAERDVLQERMEEQLLKISALQSRLDEHRRKADSLLKEANMELHTKVKDQEIELNKLREMVENKDKEVKEVKDTLVETRRIMAAQETEWNANSREEVEAVQKLRELCRVQNLDISSLQDDEGDGTLGRFIPLEALIELLVGSKDAQIDELRRQIDALNKLIDECASHLTPEQRAELERKRGQILTGGERDAFRDDESGVKFLQPNDAEDLYTSHRDVTESESEPDLAGKKGSELESLKNQLAACQKDLNEKDLYLIEAMKKLGHVHEIINENRVLLDQLENSNLKIKTLQDEKARLKKEKEDALALVKAMEDERDKLMNENNVLKEQQEKTPETLQVELDGYKAKVKELEDQERDLLQLKGNESQLLMLEVENLRNTLDQYADMERKLQELRKKADQADKCQDLLDRLEAAGIDIDGLLSGDLDELKLGSPDKAALAQKIEDLQNALDSCKEGAMVEELQKELDACREEQEKLRQGRSGSVADANKSVSFHPHVTSTDTEKLPAGKTLDDLLAELKQCKEDQAALNDLLQRLGMTPEELLNELEEMGRLKENAGAQNLSQLQTDIDALIRERDMLKRERDAMMEERNALRIQASHCSTKLEALKAENTALRMELDKLRGRGSTCQVMEQKLNCMRNERDTLEEKVQELEAALLDVKLKSGSVSNVIAERDMLRMKLNDYAGLEGELERLRYRGKEAEVLRVEHDRMKIRLDELESIEEAYHALLNKTRNMEVIAAERDMFKAKYDEIAALESEIDALRNCVDQLKGADCERDRLKRKVKELECGIADQEDEIKQLLIQVDRLSLGANEKQEDRMKTGLPELQNKLQERNDKLSDSETQLKESLKNAETDRIACEEKCTHLKKELEEALKRLDEKDGEINALHSQISGKDSVIRKISESNMKESLKNSETGRIACEEKYTRLEKELEEALKRLDEKDGEINALHSQISGKDSVIRKISESKQESLLRMSECEKEMQDLKTKIRELQACKDESETLKIELLDSKDQNTKLMKGAEALKEKLMSLVEENKILKASGTCVGTCSLAHENNNLKNRLIVTEGLVEELEKERQERQFFQAQSEELKAFSTELEAERNKQLDANEECACKLAALEIANMEVVQQLQEIKRELASAEKLKEQLQKEREGSCCYQEHMAKLVAELEQIRKKEQEAKEACACELKTMKIAKVEVEEQLRKMQDDLISIQTESETLIDEYKRSEDLERKAKQSLEKILCATQNECQIERELRISLENKLIQLQNKLKMSEDGMNELQKHIDIVTQSRKTVKIQLINLTNEFKNFKDEIAKNKTECEREKQALLLTLKNEQDCDILLEEIAQLKKDLEYADIMKNELNTKLEKYEDQFKSHVHEVTGSENEVYSRNYLADGDIASENVNTLKQHLAELEEENLNWKAKVKELTETHAETPCNCEENEIFLQNELIKLKTENYEVQTKLENVIEEAQNIYKWKENSEVLQQTLCQVEAENLELRTQLEKLNERESENIYNWEQHLAQLEEEISDWKMTIEKLNESNAQNMHKWEEKEEILQRERSKLKTENWELKMELENMLEKAENVHKCKENEIVQKELKEVRAENLALKTQLEKLNEKEAENLQNWKKIEESLLTELSEVKIEKFNLETRLEETIKTEAENMQKWMESVETLQNDIISLQSSSESNKLELEMGSTEKMRLENLVHSVELEINELVLKLADSQNLGLRLKEVENLLAEEQKVSQASEKEITHLRQQIEDLNDQIEKSGIVSTDKDHKINQLREESETDKRKTKHLEELLENLKNHNEQLSSSLKNAKCNVSELSETMSTLSNEKNDLETRHQNALKELCKCNQEIEQLAAETRRLSEERAEKLSEVNAQHKKEIENIKKTYKDNIVELKKSHDREKRIMCKRHRQSVEKLLDVYEEDKKDLINCYESKMQSLLSLQGENKSNENPPKANIVNKELLNNDRESYDEEKKLYTEKLNKELQRIKEEHVKTVRELTAEFEIEIETMKQEHKKELEKLQFEHGKEVEGLRNINSSKNFYDEERAWFTKNSEEDWQQVQDMHKGKLRHFAVESQKELDTLKQKHSDEVSQLEIELGKKTQELRERKDSSDKEKAKLNQKLSEELQHIQDEHMKNVKELTTQSDNEIETMKQKQKEELERLRTEHAKSTQEITEVGANKDFYNEEKALFTKKLDEDLQRIRDKHTKKIKELTAQLDKESETIKQKHKKVLKQLQMEHQKKIEEIKKVQPIKEKLQALSFSKLEVCNYEPEKTPRGGEVAQNLPSKSTLEPKIEEIINKILHEGIGTLSFADLSYLHQQICKATCSTLLKDSTPAEQCWSSLFSASGDRETLQKHVLSLENEITQKQKESEKKVFELESAIRRERQQIENLKEKLEEEQMKNMDLQNRLRVQTRSVGDMQVERDLFQKQLTYHEDRVREFIVQLEQEKAKVRKFEDDLSKEKNCVKHLQSLLDAERQRARCSKLQDSELIENMRIKLEIALANENKLRFQKEKANITHDTAEKLDCSCNKASCTAFALGGKLELEQERCSKLELDLRSEQRRAEELEAAIEKERQLGLQKIEIEKEIVHQLKRELLALEGQRDSLNSQLVHVREQLSLRQVESEALERKVRVLQDAEAHKQRKRLSEQEELDKNRRALQKAQSLQYDLEQKIIDLEQEVHRLKQQLLDRKLHVSGEDPRQEVEILKLDQEESRVKEELQTQDRSPSPKISSPVLEKLKSVNVMLEQHMTENAEVALTLSRLTEERQRLQTRIRELEEQLRNSAKNKGNDLSESMHMNFAKERTIWAQERAALKVALAQAEADALHGRRIGDGADTDNRVKHLFGKFLRAESYRKALVWQKRYLLVVLGGYQESEAITVSRLAQLSGIQESMVHHHNSPSQRRPRTRFRTVAIVVIALSRMRYMVQRWRLGRRIGSGAVLSRGFSETALSTAQSSYLGPRRRGSSTSINSLGASRASSQPHRYGPLSPPSRDQPTLRRWQTDYMVQHHMRSSESIPISSLRPSHVSEYVDRFDELQRRLGLSITSPPL